MLVLVGALACDALDGHIDDPANCCQAVLDVRGCLEQHVAPGHCKIAECPTANVVLCRLPDGGLLDHWPPDAATEGLR